MNLLFLILVFSITLNSFSSKIIFEDDFNKLDQRKWDIIDGKHHCYCEYENFLIDIYKFNLVRIFIHGFDTMYDKQYA